MSSFNSLSNFRGFVQSAPIQIRWAGFESNTLVLQNNGWRIAIEDEFDHIMYQHQIRFLLRHETLNITAITSIEQVDFERLYMNGKGKYEMPYFHIYIAARDIIYTRIPEIKLGNLYEIDARPEYIEEENINFNDLPIFKTLIKPDNALIVEPDKIADILAQIVECQSPKQAEIRERIRKESGRNDIKQTLHAQILSVAA
jgi:hypothetical protein